MTVKRLQLSSCLCENQGVSHLVILPGLLNSARPLTHPTHAPATWLPDATPPTKTAITIKRFHFSSLCRVPKRYLNTQHSWHAHTVFRVLSSRRKLQENAVVGIPRHRMLGRKGEGQWVGMRRPACVVLNVLLFFIYYLFIYLCMCVFFSLLFSWFSSVLSFLVLSSALLSFFSLSSPFISSPLPLLLSSLLSSHPVLSASLAWMSKWLQPLISLSSGSSSFSPPTPPLCGPSVPVKWHTRRYDGVMGMRRAQPLILFLSLSLSLFLFLFFSFSLSHW